MRQDTPPVESEFLGLHAKTFVVDREVAYVGSHNFDPRSHEINTELGLLVESPGLAQSLAQRIKSGMRGENSWRVDLDDLQECCLVSGQIPTSLPGGL